METEKQTKKLEETKKKIDAKPLPVDKEKAKEIEEKMKQGKEEPVQEAKAEIQKEKKKEKQIIKKEEAVAMGAGLPISKKHSMYICSFIKNKTIDLSIRELGKVSKLKQAIPFKGEVPHRKGNLERGRYPVKASKYFINLLKGLKGNAITNGLDIDSTKIYIASASWAKRPMRSGGRQGKRTNIILKAKEFPNKQNKEAKK